MEETNVMVAANEPEGTQQVFRPWLRYFARMLDLTIYTVPWYAFLAFVIQINLMARGTWASFFDGLALLAVTLLFEPVLLRIFGTTAGKAVFGLRVTSERSRNLTYFEGLERTWGVIGKGLGFQIPIYSLIRTWKSYKACSDEEVLPWDEYVAYTSKGLKWYRVLACIGVILGVIGMMVVFIFAQQLPPNRGNLTVEDFVENHNYYARHLGHEFGQWELGRDGRWGLRPATGDTTFWIDPFFAPPVRPEFEFSMQDGYIQGISFDVEIQGEGTLFALHTLERHMLLALLAFICAQDEVGLFSTAPVRISEQLSLNITLNHRFTEAGVAVMWEVEHSWFSTVPGFPWVLWPENADYQQFSLSFSMVRV